MLMEKHYSASLKVTTWGAICIFSLKEALLQVFLESTVYGYRLYRNMSFHEFPRSPNSPLWHRMNVLFLLSTLPDFGPESC